MVKHQFEATASARKLSSFPLSTCRQLQCCQQATWAPRPAHTHQGLADAFELRQWPKQPRAQAGTQCLCIANGDFPARRNCKPTLARLTMEEHELAMRQTVGDDTWTNLELHYSPSPSGSDVGDAPEPAAALIPQPGTTSICHRLAAAKGGPPPMRLWPPMSLWPRSWAPIIMSHQYPRARAPAARTCHIKRAEGMG